MQKFIEKQKNYDQIPERMILQINLSDKGVLSLPHPLPLPTSCSSLVWILCLEGWCRRCRGKCSINFPSCAVCSRAEFLVSANTIVPAAWILLHFDKIIFLYFCGRDFSWKCFYFHQRNVSLHFKFLEVLCLKVYMKPCFLLYNFGLRGKIFLSFL